MVKRWKLQVKMMEQEGRLDKQMDLSMKSVTTSTGKAGHLVMFLLIDFVVH